MQDVTHTLKAEGHDASEDGTGRGVPLIVCAPVAPTLGKESFSPTKSSSGQMDDFCIVTQPPTGGGSNGL